jgi:hypothetical protein
MTGPFYFVTQRQLGWLLSNRAGESMGAQAECGAAVEQNPPGSPAGSVTKMGAAAGIRIGWRDLIMPLAALGAVRDPPPIVTGRLLAILG